ncbi:hypothetical protein L3X38_016784 [Prunus dulcis]|uniref:Uncharacterized protein n=1 Tax=Prunus dulcis TaxID=3755 RepID=A0AAD4W6W1_PRUDU|nr:hypothetical protein L3X38_016784 [Prunus dulcis]
MLIAHLIQPLHSVNIAVKYEDKLVISFYFSLSTLGSLDFRSASSHLVRAPYLSSLSHSHPSLSLPLALHKS